MRVRSALRSACLSTPIRPSAALSIRARVTVLIPSLSAPVLLFEQIAVNVHPSLGHRLGTLPRVGSRIYN